MLKIGTMSSLTVVLLSVISSVAPSVFDSIMSPTFMKPSSSKTDLFSDFFDSKGSNDSFNAFSRSLLSDGNDAAKFNFSSIVPMSRSSSSSTLFSSHTSTKSESISTLPEKTETQGINLSKVVENVEVIGPRSNKQLTSAINAASLSNPSHNLYGFNGPVTEKELMNRLTADRPQTMHGVDKILSKAEVVGQYFIIFPVISTQTENIQFYVLEDFLPKELIKSKIGNLLRQKRDDHEKSKN